MVSLTVFVIFVLQYVTITFGAQFSHCVAASRCYQECEFSAPDVECDALPSIVSNHELNGDIVFYRTSHQNNEKFNQYQLKWSTKSNKTSDTISVKIDSTKTYLQFGRMDIIHMVQDIMKKTNPKHKLHLFATPWTAPPWMKVDVDTDLDPTGYIKGHLNHNKTYWKAYANYFVKYIDAYKLLAGIDIEAVTPQKEPHSPSHWESMRWNDIQLMEFIGDYLGPALNEYNQDIQIWIHDGQKIELPEDIRPYFVSDKVSKYVKGIAMHWYLQTSPIPGCPSRLCTGSFKEIEKTNEFVMSYNRNTNDDIFMINTEACTGFSVIESPPVRGVSLGDWYRGMQYAEDIIGDIQNGVSGWVDWNFILDINGGPNHVNNTCDAPIVVDFDKHKYFKQPMYYFMAHITRFILRDSYRISIISDRYNKDLWYTSVIDKDTVDQTVVVLMNTNSKISIDVEIYDARKGFFCLSLPPHSIQTFVYGN